MNVKNCTMITTSLALPSHMKSWPASASGPFTPKGWASKKNSTSNTLATNPAMPEVNAHSTGRAVRCRGGWVSVSMPPGSGGTGPVVTGRCPVPIGILSGVPCDPRGDTLSAIATSTTRIGS